MTGKVEFRGKWDDVRDDLKIYPYIHESGRRKGLAIGIGKAESDNGREEPITVYLTEEELVSLRNKIEKTLKRWKLRKGRTLIELGRIK